MHFDIEMGLDFLEGRLTLPIQKQWTSHLDSCPECATEMDRWRAIHAAVRRTHLQSAPDAAISSAMALFQTKSDALASSARQVIASIIFDSFNEPAFAGARGQAAQRQVVLRAVDFDIHVSISETSEKREMLGQIQPRATGSFIDWARLHVLSNGERVSSVGVNSFGEFHFPSVPEGLLSLQIEMPHVTVIGTLEITKRM